MHESSITDEIAAKVNALHDGLRRELNKMCFPRGREAAVEELEETIHQLTFERVRGMGVGYSAMCHDCSVIVHLGYHSYKTWWKPEYPESIGNQRIASAIGRPERR